MAPLAGFSTRQVAQLLRVSPERVRSLVNAGFVSPRRAAGGRFLFGFQDLVVLRAARDLEAGGIGAARVKRLLQRLKEKLPRGRSLAAVRITVDGSQVVVRHGGDAWVADSGQRILDFQVADLAERAVPIARLAANAAHRQPDGPTAEDWFETGYELEATAVDEAVRAYLEAIRLDPEHTDAHVNLGRLLHEQGDVDAAARHYRRALELSPSDPTAAYDLGVALQDLGRLEEAARAYRLAIRLEPAHADAYFNLSAVYERLGRRAQAFRHLKTYRDLVGAGG